MMNIEKFLEIAKSNGMKVEYIEKGHGGYIETFEDTSELLKNSNTFDLNLEDILFECA